ncbi:MAG TPA: ATP-grasp domain-containing protein [Firmicutes bacterium]|nr:ATP-grasp domain-containing protein [Candidatus Fermentithermobacillaceae bacterium]
MHVCVITAPTGDCPLNRYDPHAARQTKETRDAVAASLRELGHEVSVLEAGPSLLLDIEALKPEVLFNMATGYRSKKDQANIAALLELSGIPFTGATSHGHLVGLHKHLAKMVMQAIGVRTPPFRVAFGEGDLNTGLTEGLRFPVIVKPAAEGSSVGITADSVVTSNADAALVASKVLRDFGPPVLVEEFISGREFTVALLGHPRLRALPPEEIIFKEGDMYTYGVKARDNVTVKCPADIPEDLARDLEDMASRAATAIGCRDAARVDIRLDGDGKAYVLEVNTLPGMMPGYSEFPRIAAEVGISFAELVKTLIEGAIYRARGENVPQAFI